MAALDSIFAPVLVPVMQGLFDALRRSFSPAQIFGVTGANGAWLDESDFSSLFQDSAGTTSVTAVEQPIGLMKDKSGRTNNVLQATAASRPVLTSRVNQALGSENYGDALYWNSAAFLSLTQNAASVVLPSGQVVQLALAIPSVTNQYHGGYNAGALQIGTNKIQLVAKPSGYRWVQVYDAGFGSFGLVVFDLVTGTFSQNSLSLPVSAVALSGGAYLISLTANSSSGANFGIQSIPTATTSNIYGAIYAGDGVSGGFFGGVHAQTGLTISVYQRITTATSYDTAGFPLYAAFNGTNSTLASTTGGGGTAGFFLCQPIAPKSRGTALATPINAAFTTAITGGTLAAGTYFYRVSSINAYGETLASAETSQVTTGATSTVTVNWGAVSGATGYKVYGRTTGAELLIATVGAVTTYTDTGAVTPAGALPAVNTTAYMTVFADNNGNSGYKVVLNYAGNLLLQSGNSTFTTINTTDVLPLGTPSLITVWDDGTNLSAQVGSSTVFSTPRPLNTGGAAAFTLGSDNGAATGFFNGNLYPEVYGQNTAFTAAQRGQIQAYCRSRAGL